VDELKGLRGRGWESEDGQIIKWPDGAHELFTMRDRDLGEKQKEDYATIRLEWEAARSVWQQRIDGAFVRDLSDAREKVQGLGTASSSVEGLKQGLLDADGTREAIQKLRERPNLSPELRPGLEAVQVQLEHRRKAIEERLKTTEDVVSATDLPGYFEALALYAATYPDDPSTSGIAKVVAAKGDYLLFGAFKGLPPSVADPGGAATAALTELVAQVGGENYFWSDVVKRYATGVQARAEASTSVREGASMRARNDLLGRLWRITFQQGRQVAEVNGVEVIDCDSVSQDGYLRWPDDTDLAQQWNTAKREVACVGGSVRISGMWVRRGAYYVPTEDDAAPEFADVQDERALFALSIDKMPHCAFLRKMASEMPAEDDDLPGYMVTKIRELIDDKDICPYLKTQLLGELARDLGAISPELPGPIVKLQKDVATINQGVAWLCTRTPDYDTARVKSIHLLAAQRFSVDSVTLEQKQRAALLDAALSRGVVWVGQVPIDGQNQPSLRNRKPLAIWVLRPGREGARMQVVEAGVSGAGEPPVTGSVALLPGEPLFAPREPLTNSGVLEAAAARHKVDVALLQQALMGLPCWPRPPQPGAP
jgi:hypothetical protein